MLHDWIDTLKERISKLEVTETPQKMDKYIIFMDKKIQWLWERYHFLPNWQSKEILIKVPTCLLMKSDSLIPKMEVE